MALQVSKVAWTEVCLGVSQTTHDLYGLKKSKDNKSWKPIKHGLLNHEFFNQLGNLSQVGYGAFAKHILN
jgi:hypothetical protein